MTMFHFSRQFRTAAPTYSYMYSIHRAGPLIIKRATCDEGLHDLAQEVHVLKALNKSCRATTIQRYVRHTRETLTTEYIEGMTLEAQMQCNPTVAQIRGALQSIVGTLTTITKAHPHFAHRDLHGRNVIVGRDTTTIIDFGSASLSTHRETVVGDFVYLLANLLPLASGEIHTYLLNLCRKFVSLSEADLLNSSSEFICDRCKNLSLREISLLI